MNQIDKYDTKIESYESAYYRVFMIEYGLYSIDYRIWIVQYWL